MFQVFLFGEVLVGNCTTTYFYVLKKLPHLEDEYNPTAPTDYAAYKQKRFPFPGLCSLYVYCVY